jgi:pyruvate/2-oxoglutarate dehydrogenase complex dihydrolipoamide dehydrogenase (E3) component
MESYDVIVIGGGGAGITASFTAAGFGKKTLVIEEKKMGGECTWSGCIPSKALINFAFTSKINGIVNPEIMKSVQSIQETVYNHESPEVLKEKGIDFINGAARFIDKKTIEVNGKKIESKKFIIATGTSPFVPPLKGIDEVPYLTNETLFLEESLPKSLIILGGGPIGVEMGQTMNRLGVKVIVIEISKMILSRDDEELREIMQEILEKEGVTIIPKTRASSIEKISGGIRVIADKDGSEIKVEAEKLLISVGRRANLKKLDLVKAGVRTHAKGIEVNKYLQSTNPRIFAAGDITGPYLFSHMAEYQGKTAALNALLPWKSAVNYKHVAWTTFTDPEMSQAGLKEEEAEKHYSKIRIYRYNFEDLDRTKTHPGEKGLLKIICDKKFRILGASIVGPRAGELIGEIQLMKTLGIPLTKAVNVIHPYPTYGDIIRQIAKQAYMDKVLENPVVKIASVFRKGGGK